MDYGVDYYGKEGCCLTCDDGTRARYAISLDKCLCPMCKCRKCVHYDPSSRACTIALEEQEKWEEIYFEIGDKDIKAKTPKAILVAIDKKDCWLPISLVHTEERYGKFLVVMPAWLALEKGLIDGYD